VTQASDVLNFAGLTANGESFGLESRYELFESIFDVVNSS